MEDRIGEIRNFLDGNTEERQKLSDRLNKLDEDRQNALDDLSLVQRALETLRGKDIAVSAKGLSEHYGWSGMLNTVKEPDFGPGYHPSR